MPKGTHWGNLIPPVSFPFHYFRQSKCVRTYSTLPFVSWSNQRRWYIILFSTRSDHMASYLFSLPFQPRKQQLQWCLNLAFVNYCEELLSGGEFIITGNVITGKKFVGLVRSQKTSMRQERQLVSKIVVDRSLTMSSSADIFPSFDRLSPMLLKLTAFLRKF